MPLLAWCQLSKSRNKTAHCVASSPANMAPHIHVRQRVTISAAVTILPVRHGHRLTAMPEDRVDPEGCLRSLTAEALLCAHAGRELFPVSLGVMAVANAFVMLGLLPESAAEAILAEHRSALERQGFGES